ncbi:hypothetical protein [Methylotenera sp.]|uniref:hypothetical protein n=1 Tax=Methylotenera sp. TaxID=2051956 RepID=UPI002730EC86|nr:hypothetical protein [Methylotenera sp.]MDP2071654.1 hypothetical protein [Methylotenera sp.]MDP3006744.1 hypothetical protein [Methylotenera sp.]
METTKRTLIILTATVSPMVDVVRANPEARLNDYLKALERWWQEFKSLPVDILFCENSGYDLKSLRDWIVLMNAGNRIRVFQFNGDKSLVANSGKGAGEAEMFDECFHNNLISGYDYILKSTGRLFVSNARHLLEQTINKGSDWAISFRSPLDFVDARFFIIKLELFDAYLLGLGKEVNDKQGAYIEHAMLRRVCRAISDGHKWGQFEELPRYEGVGGTDGKQHSSLLGNLRYFVKNGLHRLGIKFGIYWYL